jgi:hypothetical protein
MAILPIYGSTLTNYLNQYQIRISNILALHHKVLVSISPSDINRGIGKDHFFNQRQNQ